MFLTQNCMRIVLMTSLILCPRFIIIWTVIKKRLIFFITIISLFFMNCLLVKLCDIVNVLAEWLTAVQCVTESTWRFWRLGKMYKWQNVSINRQTVLALQSYYSTSIKKKLYDFEKKYRKSAQKNILMCTAWKHSSETSA